MLTITRTHHLNSASKILTKNKKTNQKSSNFELAHQVDTAATAAATC